MYVCTYVVELRCIRDHEKGHIKAKISSIHQPPITKELVLLLGKIIRAFVSKTQIFNAVYNILRAMTILEFLVMLSTLHMSYKK